MAIPIETTTVPPTAPPTVRMRDTLLRLAVLAATLGSGLCYAVTETAGTYHP